MIHQDLKDEISKALNKVYGLRGNIIEELMKDYENEYLWGRLEYLDKIIREAEIVIDKGDIIKEFCRENYKK